MTAMTRFSGGADGSLDRDADLAVLDPCTSREDVLASVDREVLQTAPYTLLLTTALALSPPDALELTEDAVLRQSAALVDSENSLAAHAKILADAFVLTNVEFQHAILAYTKAEDATPQLETFKNPQHYVEALKVHERRMDRLLRARKDAFERLTAASEAYRQAVLTRDGLNILRVVAEHRGESLTDLLGAVKRLPY